jgi:hypothetical protein
VPHALRSSGRWKSGWLNSTSGSRKWTRAPASCPAGGAARVGWLESCPSWRAPSGRGKRRALKPGDRQRQTSNAVAAVAAGVAEVPAAPEAAIDRAPVGSRRFRVRRVLSGGRREGSAGTPHPDPPPQGGRERRGDGTHHADPLPRGRREMCPGGHPQATRAIPTAAGGGGVEGEDAARDRTVRQRVAARRVAARRQADTPRPPEFAGIEWTSGALA